MAQKRISENPKITDEIIFEFTTPDDDGCLLADPYKVDKISHAASGDYWEPILVY